MPPALRQPSGSLSVSARKLKPVRMLPALALFAITLAGCDRHNVPRGVAGQYATVSAQKIAAPRESASPAKSLAYEHSVQIELPKDLLSARLAEARSACESRKDLACTVLDVSYGTEYEVPEGRLRMRLAPEGVDSVIEIAAKGGRITSRSTHGEDLATPIADTDRELSLLTTHRDRLGEFLKRKDLNVDQVINLSKEISSTQTQIDSLNTQKANLQRRIDTELLAISFSPPKGEYAAGQTPIMDAIRSFGENFKEAVAQVIRFVAALLPWLVILVPGLVLLRLFWRWMSRWLGRREPRS